MEYEKTIRGEAIDFFKREIQNSDRVEAIEIFHSLKSRLSDFYSDENKSIFIARPPR